MAQGPGEREPRTAEDAAAHIADVINSASAFFEAYGRGTGAWFEDGPQFEVEAHDGERFLVTVTALG